MVCALGKHLEQHGDERGGRWSILESALGRA